MRISIFPIAPPENPVSIHEVTEQRNNTLCYLLEETLCTYIYFYRVPTHFYYMSQYIKGWSYDDVLKYFMRSENSNVSDADQGYHGQDGLLSVTDVPYRTPVAKAFVDAGLQIGLPIIDVNGEKQIGINYLQVICS